MKEDRTVLSNATFLFLLFILGSGSAFSQESWWTQKPSGFYNSTSFGIITARGNLFTGMQSSAGYKINPHLGFGGGIGIERFTDTPTYDTLTANLSMLPLFAEIRYTLLDDRISPVIAVNGGYKVLLNVPSSQLVSWSNVVFPGFFWTDFYEYDTYTQGGLFFTVEAGVKAQIWERIHVYLSADYSYWSMTGDHHLWMYEHQGGNTTETHEVSRTVAYAHMFVVRLGFGL